LITGQVVYASSSFNLDARLNHDTQGPDRGSCRIALNREVMATIPTYASTYQTPSVVWRFSKLAYGMHTIEISVEDATSPNGCELDRFMCVRFTSFPLPF
jgi:hypothetical protein